MKVLAQRPLTLAGSALLGWALSSTVDMTDFVASPAYLNCAALLLGIGLVASASDIHACDLRGRFGTVFSAVTIGVLVKAGLIATAMYAITREPMAIVLGIAVAQIDPLAVAAMQRGGRLSPRARSILNAWASFDDPVTVLLTVYATGFALGLTGGSRQTSLGTSGERLGDFAVDLVQNAALAAVAWLLWQVLRRLRRSARTDGRRKIVDRVGIGLLALLIVVGAWQFLMLGLAVTGLFFRPPLGRALRVGSDVAFHIAAFGLGLLLVNGFTLGWGLLLAAAALGAHALVSVPISVGLTTQDRAYLAAGQQNGMTAVILALVLDRDFPGVVGIVAPAVVTIAIVHAVWNSALDRYYRPRDDDADEDPVPREPALPVTPAGSDAKAQTDEKRVAAVRHARRSRSRPRPVARTTRPNPT